jgi:hypothetical protein
MARAHFTVHTTLTPDAVLKVLTDFGPERSRWWPNIDDAHFTVHEQGPDWAEVTEGTSLAWERERYSWDAAAGTVEVQTLESNTWGPGSGWRYELSPVGGGTDVHVTVTRVPRSLVGRLISAIFPLIGGRTLGRQLESVLRAAESR